MLKLRYQGAPSPSQIETLKAELVHLFSLSTPTSTTPNNTLTIARRHLNLHRLATQTALFRTDTEASSLTTIQDAANAVNDILEKSTADGTAVYAALMIVLLVVPALYTHLVAARSRDVMTARLGRRQLDFGLRFLGALEGNYPAEGIVGRLFAAALAVGRKMRGRWV